VFLGRKVRLHVLEPIEDFQALVAGERFEGDFEVAFGLDSRRLGQSHSDIANTLCTHAATGERYVRARLGLGDRIHGLDGGDLAARA